MDPKHPVLVGLVFASALVAGVSTLGACAAESAPPSNSESVTATETPGNAAGSVEAKEELGVVRWTSSDDGTTSNVKGLDKFAKAVVEFQSTRETVDETHRTVRYDLRTRTGEWFVDVDVEEREGETHASIAGSSFADIAPAKRALEIIENDFGSQGASLTTRSLEPRNGPIVTGCANLVSCVQIVGYDSASFGACLEAAFNGAALGKCNAAQEADRKIRAECGGNFDGSKAVCLPKL